MPHKSRITKIKRRHHSLPHAKSDLNSFKTNSIIHATIRTPKKDDLQTNTGFLGNGNNSDSNYKKPNMLKSTSLIRSYPNTIQKASFCLSNTQSELKNIQPSVASISIKQYSQRDTDYDQSWMKECHSKTSKIENSEIKTSCKNQHSTILNETKKRKNRNYLRKRFPFLCSLPCILVFLLIGLLLVAAFIGSIIVVLLGSKTTTTSITLITTTVITTVCSSLCPNESWTFNSDRLTGWSFDGTLTDTTNIYNATSYNNPSFVTNGYVNQALLFNAALLQSLSAPYIPLANTSFTIEVWLKPTLFPNVLDHSILGLCPTATYYECLYLVIRTNGLNQHLYMGFFNDDCEGNTSLTLNQWIHAAFVFDITTLTQSIYLNGVLDNRCVASSPIITGIGSITIGTVPALIPLINTNFYQGYIDHLTITKRVKSSCEILEDATLATCFLFDAVDPYVDSGPNSLLNSELSTSIISPGHSGEALSFNGTSFFQASSFTALGISNKPLSILLWLRPRSVSGVIVHVSSFSNGTGWCIPFLGITTNGSVIAQVYNSGTVTVWGPSVPMISTWSHIVQTWSSVNGLRLYINSTLVASNSSAVVYTASGLSNYVTLPNTRAGMGVCHGGGLGTLAPGSLDCDMDDFRVYSRELTGSEILTIYGSR